MRRLLALTLILGAAPQAMASGLLIPTEVKVPPLALLDHRVDVGIEMQVAMTTIEQVFRNHTDSDLEVQYVFPVPKGASVRKFTMWNGDKEIHGEMVEAAKAKEIYHTIVSRTKDPGLLEYVGKSLIMHNVLHILQLQ